MPQTTWSSYGERFTSQDSIFSSSCSASVAATAALILWLKHTPHWHAGLNLVIATAIQDSHNRCNNLKPDGLYKAKLAYNTAQ